MSTLWISALDILHMNASAALFKDSAFSNSKIELIKGENLYAMVSNSRLAFMYLLAITAAVIANMKSGAYFSLIDSYDV